MPSIPILEHPKLPQRLFKTRTGVAVLVDANTRVHCYGKVSGQLPPHSVIEVPAGEKYKNIDTCQQIWQGLTDAGLDRHALLVVLGGGVLGDLGGFCASTYKRGLDFMLVPTTLLAMADASIGGKTGIDFGPLKNHIGTFTLPVATLIATDFLSTLPERECRSGFAEIIKHALISNRKLWNTIRSKPIDKQPWPVLLRHSVKFKSSVVAKDPLEKGLRKVLNYGHTLGHALEGYFLLTKNTLLHGEAIAAGMVLEAYIAFSKKLLDRKDLEDISTYLLVTFGKVQLPEVNALMPGLSQDKKNKGRVIRAALPKSIGKAVYDIPVSEREIRDATGFYRDYQT